MENTYEIKVNYDRTEDPATIGLLLTAYVPIPGLVGITQGVPISIADFKRANKSMTITLGDTNGGRLYVGILPFPDPTEKGLPPAPVPCEDQYYGWVEFTRLAADPCVWTNLSNVDVLGLPLTMTGTDNLNKPFALGYQTSVIDIQKSLRNSLKNSPYVTDAVVSCPGASGPTSYTKIVGPNNAPRPYPQYDAYLKELTGKNAQLVITSDVPGAPYTGAETFTGNFTDVGENIITLTGDDHPYDTIEILRSQLTDDVIYSCAGGTLTFDNQTYSDNDGPATGDQSPQQKVHNSIFRKICVGLNEGYFVTDHINYSSNFPYYKPFTKNPGNIYANAIHTASNSYGFPYSDSNLKVQALAGRTSTITLNIIKDDAVQDYTQNAGKNIIDSGKYQFGIGTNSNLGIVQFGNCRYLPTSENAYGGFLPTSTKWFKMIFGTPNQYIWIKTPGSAAPDFECGDALSAKPFWSPDNVLTWGADIKWNPGAVAPPKPTR